MCLEVVLEKTSEWYASRPFPLAGSLNTFPGTGAVHVGRPPGGDFDARLKQIMKGIKQYWRMRVQHANLNDSLPPR